MVSVKKWRLWAAFGQNTFYLQKKNYFHDIKHCELLTHAHARKKQIKPITWNSRTLK